MKPSKQDEEGEVKFNPFQVVMADDSLGTPGFEHPPLQTPEIIQSEVDTPCSELKDPSYHPSDTAKPRREIYLLVLRNLLLDLSQGLCHTIL